MNVLNLASFMLLDGNGEWDVGTFLKTAGSTLKTWGGYIMTILGAIGVIVAVYLLVMGLINHGKQQTNWVVPIVLLLVSGSLLAGGWTFVEGVAKGGKKTIEDLGKGEKSGDVGGQTGNTILPFYFEGIDDLL